MTDNMQDVATYQDGRQSEAALRIARGTARMLAQNNFFAVPELTLSNGRRADLVALGPKGQIWILEIKSSVNDYRTDHKWTEYKAFCDRFYFAVSPEFPSEIIPEETGLVVADRYGAEIVRETAESSLPAVRRKAVTLAAARVSSARLQSVIDPEFALELSGRF